MAATRRPSGSHKVKALETLRLEKERKQEKNIAFVEG